MSILNALPVAFVALLHVYILHLEMFLWATPKGIKSFGMTPEFAQQSKVLASNQGLYNGFLAAGLIWGLLHPIKEFGVQVQVFFLGCVAVAGLYGTWSTGKSKLMLVQTVPAAVAFAGIALFD